MPTKTLLDTNILSAYMRQEPSVVTQAEAYLQEYGHFNISLMTRYEILRGLKARGASARLRAFDRLCQANRVLPITGDVIEQAADLYADLHRRGELIGDADTLIAATALVYRLAVVTNNEKHFSRVAGLQVENWLT